MLKEAVQTSYRRGGEESSLTGNVNKQTAKNKIHGLKFPRNEKNKRSKKKLIICIWKQMKTMLLSRFASRKTYIVSFHS